MAPGYVAGMLERQRVKAWLRSTYEVFDGLPL